MGRKLLGLLRAGLPTTELPPRMSRVWATENKIPDLSHLPIDRVAIRMVATLTGDRGREYPDRVMLSNFARLVDRAVVLYQEGRDLVDDIVATGPNPTYLFRAISTFEWCLTCVHRAGEHAKELATRGLIDSGLLRIDPRVKELRDAIFHVEDRLLGRRPPPIEFGDLTFLTPTTDGLEIGKHRLPYEVLAETLTSLHAAVGQPIR